ncbi:MAG: carboxypeptidase-like regulatory domain-containing protein, partial [Gemmatimonadetes bacterium]
MPGTQSALAAQWPGEIHVRVVDAVQGDPVAQARVRIESTTAVALTDAGGFARLRAVEPGTYTLSADALSYATVRKTVQVRNGEVTRVTLALEPLGLAL